MKKYRSCLFILQVAAILSSCTIVRPGEVGIKQRLGQIRGESLAQGPYYFNPFTTTVLKIPIRTVEAFNVLDLPTKEGLLIKAEIALLYHVKPETAKDVYVKYGRNYEEVIVESNFRAAARHISASYTAKDLYAVDRKMIEKSILDEVAEGITDKGFVVDAVLLKSITMPSQIFQAVENKLKAEQESLQMDFVITRQRKEAERMQIEAVAIRDYQKTISEGLNELLIKWNGIQVLKELVKSSNAKVIVTDGKSPIILQGDK